MVVGCGVFGGGGDLGEGPFLAVLGHLLIEKAETALVCLRRHKRVVQGPGICQV